METQTVRRPVMTELVWAFSDLSQILEYNQRFVSSIVFCVQKIQLCIFQSICK